MSYENGVLVVSGKRPDRTERRAYHQMEIHFGKFSSAVSLPGPVDLILIVDTFHHIPKRQAYFTDRAKFLKPGGRLAIIDWLPGGPLGPPAAFRFSPEKIAEEVGTAGWKKIGQHAFLPNQSFGTAGSPCTHRV